MKSLSLFKGYEATFGHFTFFDSIVLSMATDCDVMHDQIIRSKVPKLDLKKEVGKVLKLHKYFSNLVFKRSGKQTQSN